MSRMYRIWHQIPIRQLRPMRLCRAYTKRLRRLPVCSGWGTLGRNVLGLSRASKLQRKGAVHLHYMMILMVFRH